LERAEVFAPYRFEPVGDARPLLAALDDLRRAVMTGSLDHLRAPPLPGLIMWSAGMRWLSTVQNRPETAPTGLRAVLAELPWLLAHNASVLQALLSLLRMCVMRADRAADEEVRVSFGASSFAGLVLELVVPVRTQEFLEAARVVWNELAADMQRCAPHDMRCRTRLRRWAGHLGGIVSRVDRPEAYQLLLLLLKHPWPEIRAVGAFVLRDWRGDRLVEHLCEALALGSSDPTAAADSATILRGIGRRGDPRALPTLRSLEGSAFDGPLLQWAIRRCSGRA